MTRCRSTAPPTTCSYMRIYTRRNSEVPAKRRDPNFKQTSLPSLPIGALWCPIEDSPQAEQQCRRCCPFVAIERVLLVVSRFLLGDTPSYLSTPLLYFESEATCRRSPRGYEILWEPKRFTRSGSPPICFSLRVPTAMAAARVLATSKSNNVATSIQRFALKEGVNVIIVLYKTVLPVRNCKYCKKRACVEM